MSWRHMRSISEICETRQPLYGLPFLYFRRTLVGSDDLGAPFKGSLVQRELSPQATDKRTQALCSEQPPQSGGS
jgi:hypothetical protein